MCSPTPRARIPAVAHGGVRYTPRPRTASPTPHRDPADATEWPSCRRACVRCASPAATPDTPKAPRSSSSATPAVLCNATVEDRVPPWMKGRGRGWVTAEYGMLPRSTGQRSPREAGARAPGRTDAGDPAPHRTVAPRGGRPGGARGAHDHCRLRRHPGRWRDAHGGDHRRVRRPRGCRLAPAGHADGPRRESHPRSGGGGLGRHLAGRAGAGTSTTPRTPRRRPT